MSLCHQYATAQADLKFQFHMAKICGRRVIGQDPASGSVVEAFQYRGRTYITKIIVGREK